MEPLNISHSRAALSRKSHQLSTFPKRNSVSMEPKSSSKLHSNQHNFRIQKQQSPFRLRDPFAPEINAEELSELFADILLADNPAKQRKSCFGLLSSHANHAPKEHSEAPKFSVVGQHTQLSAVTEDRNEKIDEKADFIKTASKHQSTPNHEGAPSLSKTLNTESCNQYKMVVSRCTEKGTNSTLDPSSLENLDRKSTRLNSS